VLESGQRVAVRPIRKDCSMNEGIALPVGPVEGANAKGRNSLDKAGPVGSPMREIRPAFMTVPEVARRLHVSEKTVRRLVDRRKFPRCRHLGKVLIPFESVEKWIIESTKH
jgi:excisionase family DNA binding protein